jgi:hydroxyacylglutathione hydrolase
MARKSLEDNFTDILGKAQRGLKLSDQDLAERAGISIIELGEAKAGQVIEPVLRKLAGVLALRPDALVASAKEAWYPEPISMDGLAQFTTPYYDMTVNSYLLWDPATREAAAFDTGADAQPIIAFFKAHRITVRYILLTHSHSDHIADLAALQKEIGAPAFISEKESVVRGAEAFAEGRQFTTGAIKIATRQTSGHSPGGTTYVVTGLARPVAVVGDALFAGSMGGGMVSYSEALENNRRKIMTLPDETIICPGHGPLTTVGEEKQHNPFFPEFGADQTNI